MKELVIIGAGGHATSVASVSLAAGFKVVAFIGDVKSQSTLLGLPIFSKIDQVPNVATAQFIIAVGDNAVRERIVAEIERDFPTHRFPVVVHPTASIGINSIIANGTVIMPNVTVGPKSNIGQHCILNSNSSFDHDCDMGDFSSLAPGVTVGGGVKIGMSSAIGIGATVQHGITIAEDVVVGGASYVNKDLPKQVVCFGVPAKIIRSRMKFDPYLS